MLRWKRDDEMLIRIGILILAVAAIAIPAWAQELDPRAYQPAFRSYPVLFGIMHPAFDLSGTVLAKKEIYTGVYQ